MLGTPHEIGVGYKIPNLLISIYLNCQGPVLAKLLTRTLIMCVCVKVHDNLYPNSIALTGRIKERESGDYFFYFVNKG